MDNRKNRLVNMSRLIARVFVLLFIFAIKAQIAAAQTDVVLAVDLSGTMKTNDPNNYRFIGADQFLVMFSLYGNNKGGAVSFGNDASVIMPLEYISFDKAGKYQNIFAQLGVDDWTELGKGLELSRTLLGNSADRSKSIILISDGIIEGNPGTRGLSKDQAKAAAERELWDSTIRSLQVAHIKVYTIGLFREDKRGEATLQRIARETRGVYTHVDKPEEFSKIYKKMLDDIDQPSGITDLSKDNNTIVLTPTDEGVIIVGPLRFVVKAPNNIVYSTDRETSGTPVKQKHFEYSDGTAILFLGRPDDIKTNESFWTGKWLVEELRGAGQATYISNVRLGRGDSIPKRSEFFLNEFYPIEYEFKTRPGIDLQNILPKCSAEYILIPQGQTTGDPASGKLGREENIFKGEYWMNHEGEYLLQIKIVYENVDKWQYQERFHVNNTPLVELRLNPDGEAVVGSPFRIEGKQNSTAFTSAQMTTKGLTNGVMSFQLAYGSNEPISLNKISAGSDGIYRTEELEYRKPETLRIEGLITGDLIMQGMSKDGTKVDSYPIKAKVLTTVKVQDTWIRLALKYGGLSFGVLSFLLTAWGVLMQFRVNQLSRAKLVGPSVVRLEPRGLSLGEKLKRLFRRSASVDIGGPQSGASVKMPGAGKDQVLELGIDGTNRYYVIQKGQKMVYLNSERNPLEFNKKVYIGPKDLIIVEGVGQFKFNKD